jgi:hypothetical protein
MKQEKQEKTNRKSGKQSRHVSWGSICLDSEKYGEIKKTHGKMLE